MNTRRAIQIFRKNGGMLRTMEAIHLGIHPRTLYALRDQNEIQRIDNGLYCLPGLPDLDQPDLALVSARCPKGVICLESALFYHGLTLEIPSDITVALPTGTIPPNIEYPPTRFHRFALASFEMGAVEVDLGGRTVRIYDPERTIVDCFKFRNKIGIEMAREALRTWWREQKGDLSKLMVYARALRQETVMEPYLDTIVNET